jgi:hypothetical protein
MVTLQVIVLTDGGELTGVAGSAVVDRLALPSLPAMPGWYEASTTEEHGAD